jgi:hypothetical protein
MSNDTYFKLKYRSSNRAKFKELRTFILPSKP